MMDDNLHNLKGGRLLVLLWFYIPGGESCRQASPWSAPCAWGGRRHRRHHRQSLSRYDQHHEPSQHDDHHRQKVDGHLIAQSGAINRYLASLVPSLLPGFNPLCCLFPPRSWKQTLDIIIKSGTHRGPFKASPRWYDPRDCTGNIFSIHGYFFTHPWITKVLFFFISPKYFSGTCKSKPDRKHVQESEAF